jgi:hypothetical protein
VKMKIISEKNLSVKLWAIEQRKGRAFLLSLFLFP